MGALIVMTSLILFLVLAGLEGQGMTSPPEQTFKKTTGCEIN